MARGDFQSAVDKFGINAMLFRIIDLCEGYPASFRNKLVDFRAGWQWREIARVRHANPELDARGAHRLYYLCTLLNAPDNIPDVPELADAVLDLHDFCCPWNSVISLEGVGAFDEHPGEVDDFPDEG